MLDERVLPLGAALHTALTLEWLGSAGAVHAEL